MLSKCTEMAAKWCCVIGAAWTIGLGACGNTKTNCATDGGSGGGTGTDGAAGDGGVPQTLVILHTNDLHSHFMGYAPEADYTPASVNDDKTVGGLARMASAIGAAKSAAAASGTPVLLLDGGDFMMGTLFELAATSQAPELRFFQLMGYDAAALGNHELDWTPNGLAAILDAATKAGVTVPVLSSNMTFNAASTGDDALQAFAEGGALKAKLVKTVGTLKVGFFGLLGADAVQVTPQAAPLAFEPIDVAAARMVAELRQVDKVDLVVALSHSGIDSTGKGEDADLAMKVPGIDIIISGHTHAKLTQPKVVGKTVIVTAGSYGQFLGNLKLTVTPSATPGGQPTIRVDGYELQDINDKIPGEESTQAFINTMIMGLDTQLAPSKLAYSAVVAHTTGDLPLPGAMEAPVGNLVADAYRAVGAAVQPTDPPVIGVEANGQLRAPIIAGTTGQIWFSDLFRVTPLGIGPNQVPGFPLVTFYLNAKDIRSGLELGAAPELVPNDYFLQVSGLKAEYDMSKPAFGRVSSLTLVKSTGDVPLDLADTTTCYKVIATNYVAGLLGVVESFTKKALSVVAKDATCTTPIDPTTRFVDADPTTTGVDELKQWQAVLKYVTGLPPATGGLVPEIPAAYLTAQGRIVKK